MLTEKQIATIIVKVKIRKVLRKMTRGIWSRQACEDVVLEYMRKNVKFARAVHKAGMNTEKVVNLLYNAR